MFSKISITIEATEIDTSIQEEPKKELRYLRNHMSEVTKEEAIELVSKFFDRVDSL